VALIYCLLVTLSLITLEPIECCWWDLVTRRERVCEESRRARGRPAAGANRCRRRFHLGPVSRSAAQGAAIRAGPGSTIRTPDFRGRPVAPTAITPGTAPLAPDRPLAGTALPGPPRDRPGNPHPGLTWCRRDVPWFGDEGGADQHSATEVAPKHDDRRDDAAGENESALSTGDPEPALPKPERSPGGGRRGRVWGPSAVRVRRRCSRNRFVVLRVLARAVDHDALLTGFGGGNGCCHPPTPPPSPRWLCETTTRPANRLPRGL
jgi:hypothetical protein